MTHRITSIKNAIAWFEQGTRIIQRGNNVTYQPPRGFIRMDVTHYGGITYKYGNWCWYDYVKMFRQKAREIAKIVLY